MKNVKWLLTVLFIFSICIPSFAGHVPLHGHLKKKQRSVNLDVPIKADIDETSKVLSLEFLEYRRGTSICCGCEWKYRL